MSATLSRLGQVLLNNWAYPLGVISIISNLLVLLSSGLILKSKLQPRSTYMFLGNLALADFLHGTVFLCVLTFFPTIKRGFTCVSIIGLTASYVIECSLSVCLIAIDRYIYIHHGLHYSIWMTTKRTRLILLGSWTFSMVAGSIPQMLFADYTTSDENCSFFDVTPLYLMIAISCAGIFFETATIVLYILIFKTAFKTKRAIHAGSRRKTSKTPDKSGGDCSGCGNEIKDNESTVLNVNGIDSRTTIDPNNIGNLSKVSDGSGSKDENVSSNSRPTPIFKEMDKVYAEKERKNKQQNKMKTKSTTIVFLSLCSCTVTWGPCFVCLMIYPMFCTNFAQSNTCFSLANVLLFIVINVGLINAVMNPIIYCWWHKGFRNYLKNLCFKKASRDRRRNDFLLALRTS